jgi:eukaryotic-like serine/threonine-protein kinase
MSEPELAGAWGTDPKRLAAVLRGDLDWVVMKALEKDRTQRVDTAAGLAQDIEPYLGGVPVTARAIGRTERAERAAR